MEIIKLWELVIKKVFRAIIWECEDVARRTDFCEQGRDIQENEEYEAKIYIGGYAAFFYFNNRHVGC